MGNLQYVYSSEIMPLRYRHLGFALSVSCQWVMAFITVFAGPIAIANPSVGWKTWIWFLVFNAIAVPFGKSLHLCHGTKLAVSITYLVYNSRANYCEQSTSAALKHADTHWKKLTFSSCLGLSMKLTLLVRSSMKLDLATKRPRLWTRRNPSLLNNATYRRWKTSVLDIVCVHCI